MWGYLLKINKLPKNNKCIKCKNSPKEYRSYCKSCFKEHQREHYLKNKDNKDWYGYDSEYQKQYKEKYKNKAKEYNLEYKNKKYKEDLSFKLKHNIRCLIYTSFKSKSILKSKTKTEKILGCSFNEFKQYIESQFKPWMTWENKGGVPKKQNTNWDIDHIIPISSAKTKEDIIKLNHYTNLRPLCSYNNRWIKRNIYK
jgi:hypothetical protein